MNFNCAEPTHKNIGKDFCDWKFTLKKGFAHHVTFPHVDTCLGVVCDLGKERYFFGHINGFFQNDFSAESHRKAFVAMMDEINNETVHRAIVFGDIYERANVYKWGGLVNPIPLLKSKNVTIMDSSNRDKYPKGVDVLFDIDNSSLKLMLYKENRDFKVAENGVVLNLKSVEGINKVMC